MLLPYWLDVTLWHSYYRWKGRKIDKSRFMLRQAVHRLRPDNLAIDCGVNVGEVASIFAATGATVHAFEPRPVAFAELTVRMKAFPNVILHNVAVGMEAGCSSLFLADAISGNELLVTQSSSMFATKYNIDASKSIEIEIINFISFIEHFDRPISVLKMNIEDMGVTILEGLIERNLIQRLGMVFVETHERKIPELYDRTMRLKEICHRDFVDKIFLDWH